MTQPTPAQIALKPPFEIYDGVHIADASGHICTAEDNDFAKLILAALTAAAQVGEQELDCGCGYDDPSDVCMVHEPIVKLHVAATIERCAQVAEEQTQYYGYGKAIAAAIRKLKDAP